jgi:pimeloyl-ACP methyl ester carboxylesterase
MSRKTSFETVDGVAIELERHGAGEPLLLLAGEEMLERGAPFAAALASRFEVIAPAPPGFGRSSRPDWITCPDDIAYLYLSLIEKLDLEKITVIGCSLGGWLAAEIATKDDARLARLVLVDAYGVKLGGPMARDIADIWQLSPAKVATLRWREPEKFVRAPAAMSDEELAAAARNTEAFARFCWEPYMHNPKLKHRLGRIAVPSLVVWGEADGIVTPDYGRLYAGLIPGAGFAVIPEAAHYPHLERPRAFLDATGDFLRTPGLSASLQGETR